MFNVPHVLFLHNDAQQKSLSNSKRDREMVKYTSVLKFDAIIVTNGSKNQVHDVIM